MYVTDELLAQPKNMNILKNTTMDEWMKKKKTNEQIKIRKNKKKYHIRGKRWVSEYGRVWMWWQGRGEGRVTTGLLMR